MNSQEWTPPVLTDEQRAHLTAWCEDLESNKYVQTTNRLRNKLHFDEKNAYGYCCLGVACNTFKKHTGRGDWSVDGRFMGTYCSGSPTSLPYFVAEWLTGETSAHRGTLFVFYKGKKEDVINLNDCNKLTFKEIAHAVRETYGLPRAGENKEV